METFILLLGVFSLHVLTDLLLSLYDRSTYKDSCHYLCFATGKTET